MQEEGDHFNLEDVSDGDDDYGNDDDEEVNCQPLPRSRARDTAPIAEEINDPDISSSKKAAEDTNYFFHKTDVNKVCQECL